MHGKDRRRKRTGRTRAGRAAALLGALLLVARCGGGGPAEDAGAREETAAAEPRSLSGKRILLVHSYHSEYPWVDAITRGVRWTLKGTGVETRVFHMDTKRNTGDE